MAKSSLWHSAGPLVAGRAASAAIGFALPIILARQLDATAYGTYKQVFLIANLALYSLQLGLSQSLFYFVPRAGTEQERRQFIGQTQAMLFLIALVTFGGLILATPVIADRFSNPHLDDIAVPLALLAAALVASAPFEVALTSRGRPVSSALALVASDITRIVAMLLAVRLGHGIVGLTWAAAGAACLRWVCSLFFGGGLAHLSLSRSVVKQQLAYSLPFGVAALLLYQQQQLHQVFVSARATPALFALYSIGCMQIPIVSLLYAPVSETLQVRLAALERTGETHRSGEVFSEAVDKLALIFLPLCALLIATARPGLHVLYGGRYDDAASILRIAVLSVAVSSLPLDGVFKARARTGTLLWMYAIKLTVTWPLLAIGYTVFGLEGAITAHVCVELLTKTGQLAVISSDLKMPISQMLGGKDMLRSLRVAVLSGAAGGLVVALMSRLLVDMKIARLEGEHPTGFGRLVSILMYPELWGCLLAAAITAALVLLELRHRRERVAHGAVPSMEKAA
jgi:O-antigen/teichoic acid export membrane protein